MKKQHLGILAALLLTVGIAVYGSGAMKGPEKAQTQTATEAVAVEKVGSLWVSVNPEVILDYDQNGKVVAVRANNDDGEKLMANFAGHEGKSLEEVLPELLSQIHAQGYFAEKIDGRDKNIILKLEKGSAKLSDDFMEKLVASVQARLQELGMTSKPMDLDDKDMDDDGNLTEEAAKRLAAAQLGLEDGSAIRNIRRGDDDDYEIEYEKDGVKHTLGLAATSGKTVRYTTAPVKVDLDDDDDDDDDDDRDDQKKSSTSTKKTTTTQRDDDDDDDDDDDKPVRRPSKPVQRDDDDDDDWDDDDDDD